MDPLPVGWTPDRLKRATVDDLSSLSEDVSLVANNFSRQHIDACRTSQALLILPPSLMENSDARSVVERAQMLHRTAAEGSDVSLPQDSSSADGLFTSNPQDHDAIVRLVESAGFKDFGFAVLRCDEYHDDKKWERWVKAFSALLDESLAQCAGGESIADRLVAPLAVDEDNLLSAGFAEAQDFYKYFKGEADLQAGVNTGVFLAVDDETMDSLLHPSTSVLPWVWAVDEHFDFNHVNGSQVDQYSGFFPVVITSLIPHLYPSLTGSMDESDPATVLQRPHMDMSQLWAAHDWAGKGPWREV